MTLLRRERFVAALHEGILWYAARDEHGHEAADRLALRFAAAVDEAVGKIARRPMAGPIWRHRSGYRFRPAGKPFEHRLIFYRQPEADTVELVDLIRGERDLPKRVG